MIDYDDFEKLIDPAGTTNPHKVRDINLPYVEDGDLV